MDRSIKSFVRRCLRLPADTLLSVFYAPSSVGGIDITRLFLVIPVLRLKRMPLLRNDYTIIQTLQMFKFKTILAPHIRTELGLRKPELLAYRNYIIYSIVTQISIDTIVTDTKYRHKTD